jgi:APA family basic amino acid/polyamine antiporter
VVGHTIGVGIFLSPAELIGALASPPLTLGLWLLCGGLVLAGALTFGELASRFPQAGGLYVYLREAWGERVAFLYGWQCLLVMDPGITAALAAGTAQYAALLFPRAAGFERWIAAGMIWLLALLAMAGLSLSSRVLGFLTAVKLFALAAVVLLAFTIGGGSWSHFSAPARRPPGAPSLSEAIALGLVGVFFSFGGFWEAARVADEVRDSVRTLPRALGLGVAIVTAAYLVTTAAFLYLVPVAGASDAAAFARNAGEALLGPRGPAAISAVVVVSVVGSMLALLIMAPRLYVAMARDRAFPPALATVHPQTGSPARATAILAALATVLVLAGSFREIVAFFLCTTLLFVAFAAAGLFVVRRRDGGAAVFRTPGYPATPALFIPLLLAVVGLVSLHRPLPALAGLAVVVLGFPAYRLFVGAPQAARRVE